MKKIYILYITILLVTFNFSCSDSYLDQVPDDRLTSEQTFASENNVKKYLANVYSHVPNHMSRYVGYDNAMPWLAGSDEGEYTWGDIKSNNLNIADYNASTDFINTLWSDMYEGIRSASTLMANIDNCQDCSDLIEKQYAAEARVLRALYYYHLLRIYGPVVLLGEDAIPVDADFASLGLERSTMDECVDWIVSELEQGAEELEGVSFRGANAGRVSRPFALAIKEKVLLFAASPLFNGNSYYASMTNSEGEELIPSTYDETKWKLAADAAKAFIDEFVPTTFSLYKVNDDNGDYDPYASTREAVTEEWNDEIIFARTRGTYTTYYYDGTPYHQGYDSDIKGGGALSATQEMVDSYFMENGRSIDDPLSGYQETGFSMFQAPYDYTERETFNQWVGREPRFYVGITYNNSLWLYTAKGYAVTETWYGGNSGRQAGGNDYSATGYIVRKFVQKSAWSVSSYSIVRLRLAEIYLDYAEALNEYDPDNPDILTYLNAIRDRAGIPGYGESDLEAPSSQEEMREAIRKERRVELAFESGVRFHDARRWLIATDVFNGEMHGMDINATEEEDFYNKVAFETRIFKEKHNLWPIPQDEVDISALIVQNTGW